MQSGMHVLHDSVHPRANALKTVKSHFFDHPGPYEVGTTFRRSDGHTERAVDHVQVG